MAGTDPLAIIAAPQPEVSDERAAAELAANYGIEATLRPLVSERDLNFLATAGDGSRYVFKIANAAEDPLVTRFQIAALRHIEAAVKRHAIPVNAPRVVPTLTGATDIRLEAPAGSYLARLVTFIEGTPLGERTASPALAADMGAFLAHLGRALAGFRHPGESQELLWDLQEALRLRELAGYVRDSAARTAVDGALDDFERRAMPVLGELRRQVIHSDFNADNVVIETDDHDRVAGVIDFGDMLAAPLVADVAIGASYLRNRRGDPLELVLPFVAAYHGVTPLQPRELDIVFELIQARLAASVVILDWRANRLGSDDPYLLKLSDEESSSSRFLLRLREISRGRALGELRAACEAGA